jgi:hypothetical protein
LIEKIAFWLWALWVAFLEFEDRMMRRWMSLQYRAGDIAVQFIVGEA